MKEMDKAGVKPDVNTYRLLIFACSASRDQDRADQVSRQPRFCWQKSSIFQCNFEVLLGFSFLKPYCEFVAVCRNARTWFKARRIHLHCHDHCLFKMWKCWSRCQGKCLFGLLIIVSLFLRSLYVIVQLRWFLNFVLRWLLAYLDDTRWNFSKFTRRYRVESVGKWDYFW